MSDQQVALVIGGGSGIGLAAARRLLRRGVAVVLSGRSEPRLESARRELVAAQPEGVVATSAGDAGVEADARRVVDEVIAALGHLDVCVNAAGIYEPVDLLQMDDAAWRRTMIATLDSIVHPSVAAGAVMKQGGGGRFVLISSTNAAVSEPEAAHYSAAKAAVSSLARSLAVDLAPHGIQANAIAPGWVRTDLVEEFVSNATPEALERINILGRVGEPDEIANVIEYLALDAPDYLTGATIFVDGGQTAMAPMI